jgi:hypothetical protein
VVGFILVVRFFLVAVVWDLLLNSVIGETFFLINISLYLWL